MVAQRRSPIGALGERNNPRLVFFSSGIGALPSLPSFGVSSSSFGCRILPCMSSFKDDFEIWPCYNKKIVKLLLAETKRRSSKRLTVFPSDSTERSRQIPSSDWLSMRKRQSAAAMAGLSGRTGSSLLSFRSVGLQPFDMDLFLLKTPRKLGGASERTGE